MCAPLSPPPLFLCLTLPCSLGCLWCCVSVSLSLLPSRPIHRLAALPVSLSPLPSLPSPLLSHTHTHPSPRSSRCIPPLSPWLGSQLLSPPTPHIPALPWLLACIPGHGDSTGSHNPRQLADLGWATDSQGLRGEERNRGVRERQGERG